MAPKTSGDGPERLGVELAVNRTLKSTILAESVIMQDDSPFAQQHERWKAAGVSPRNAKRNVARSMAAVMWGMWKSGGVYEPERVGVTAREQANDDDVCDGNRSDR